MTRNSDDSIVSVIRVLDAIGTPALLVDRDGALEYANACSCELLCRSPKELVGRNIREFSSARTAPAELDGLFQRWDEEWEFEWHVLRPNGSELSVLITGHALEGQSEPAQRRVLTVVDMSGKQTSEQQYSELARLSDTAIEQAIELKHYSEKLEDRVRQRTAELHEANMDAVVMLAVASEAKDTDTGAHVRRIQAYAAATAGKLGLSAKMAERIGYSSILHDVGKIHIPDTILRKPGPLTDAEREIMQTHTLIGEQILSKRPFFATAREITRLHHENWDGSGYPDGLARDKIPFTARIVHAVDVFDALTSERVYKRAWPVSRAVEHLNAGRARMFDPEVVDAFLGLVAKGTFNDHIAQASNADSGTH